MKSLSYFVRHTLGIDRAIGVTTATQLLRLFTGPITMLMIIRFLSPEDQGYFYSFAGVAGIQVFLEAGFSVSIAQFVAREFSSLRINRHGLISGKRENLSRLRSIFQKARKYYNMMAAFLAAGLGFGGYMFFSENGSHDVPWQIPWIVVSICAGFQFLLTPFWAVLEGCNRVADIALYRFGITVVAFLATFLGLLISHSIWVTVWTSVASLIVAYGYLICKWRLLARQMLRKHSSKHEVSWRKEIWGFQWRIAGTWGARYFVEAGLPAIAFQLFGPIVAGRAGMSFQLTRIVADIASSWTVTKVPLWGQYVARREIVPLQESWRKAAFHHIVFAFIGQVILLGGIYFVYLAFPLKAERFLSPFSFAGFSIGWFFYSFWLVSMHYIRAYRLEPFIFLHIVVALSFIAIIMLTKNHFGINSITYAFAIVHLPASAVAWQIMRRIRSQF